MGKLFSSSIFNIALALAFAATVECRNGFFSQVLEEMRQEGPVCCDGDCPHNVCGYYVDDGCTKDKSPDDIEGFFQSAENLAFVRCCYENKKGESKCSTISDCKDTTTLATYAEATAQCAEEGMRLCTSKELATNICCKTGGGCHSSAVWTSTWDEGKDYETVAEDDGYTCPSGYTAIPQNLDGEGKYWVDTTDESAETIESACESACAGRDGCTGFEFGPVQSAWKFYKVDDYACATFTGADKNISNGAGRLKVDSPWRSCIKPY